MLKSCMRDWGELLLWPFVLVGLGIVQCVEWAFKVYKGYTGVT